MPIASTTKATSTIGEIEIGQGKRRLEFIDVLRAIAVVSVFSLHVREYWVRGDETSGLSFIIDRIAAQGAAGVDLFIVLSGFCMTYPLLHGRGGTIASIAPKRFYRRRAIRLLPAYYVALAIVVVLLQFPTLQRWLVDEPIDWIDVVSHVLLIQPFNSETIGAINGPLWSISLEATLYLVFPLALITLRRWGWIKLVVGSIAVAIAWFALQAVSPAGSWSAGMHFWLPAHFFEFVLGMCGAYLICNPHPKQFGISLAVLALASAIGAAGTIVSSEIVRTFGWGFAAFALTIVASVACNKPGVRLAVSIVARLGIVSYSFYLLHQPFLLLTAPPVDRLGLGPIGIYTVLMPLGVLTMAAIAWAFFRAFERPFLLSGSMRDAIKPGQNPAIGQPKTIAAETA